MVTAPLAGHPNFSRPDGTGISQERSTRAASNAVLTASAPSSSPVMLECNYLRTQEAFHKKQEGFAFQHLVSCHMSVSKNFFVIFGTVKIKHSMASLEKQGDCSSACFQKIDTVNDSFQ